MILIFELQFAPKIKKIGEYPSSHLLYF